MFLWKSDVEMVEMQLKNNSSSSLELIPPLYPFNRPDLVLET